MTSNNLTRERIEAAIELIEEQKEGADREYYLHDIGVSSSLDIDIYERVTDVFDTLLTLAEAEIERQSVTDEEIEFAAMHTENILREHTLTNGTRKYWQTVLIALQAYRPEREEV